MASTETGIDRAWAKAVVTGTPFIFGGGAFGEQAPMNPAVRRRAVTMTNVRNLCRRGSQKRVRPKKEINGLSPRWRLSDLCRVGTWRLYNLSLPPIQALSGKSAGIYNSRGSFRGGDRRPAGRRRPKSLEVLKPEQRALHDGRHQADLLCRQVNAAQSVRASAIGSCMFF